MIGGVGCVLEVELLGLEMGDVCVDNKGVEELTSLL